MLLKFGRAFRISALHFIMGSRLPPMKALLLVGFPNLASLLRLQKRNPHKLKVYAPILNKPIASFNPLRIINKQPERLLQFGQHIHPSHSRHADLQLCRWL